MSQEGDLKTAVQWVHSCHRRTDFLDAVIVKEKVVTVDGNNQIVSSEDRLRTIRDPQRSFWITKEQFRTHEFKKETEFLDRLDRFDVLDKDMTFELKKALGIYPGARRSLRELCNSPYVYGADIDIEALIKMKYMRSRPHDLVRHTIGAFDIEKSVLGCNRINLISCTHEKEIYVAILDDFLYKFDSMGRRIKASLSDVDEVVKKLLGSYFEKYGFTVTYFIHSDELEIIKWIFNQIHRNKTDFIGIWNLDYDIQQIIERIEYYGKRPEDIICPPDLPEALRYVRYKRDKTKTQHITDKWHWLHATGYTQFVDSMNTYARIRKAQGKESSYKLDFIAKKELGSGKLEFEQADHHVMQSTRFLEYIAYNILDAMLLQLMDWKNHDITTMTYLTGYSPLCDFSKQTGMLKNTYYVYCQEHGRVTATAGSDMVGKFDQYLNKIGGAVLRSELARNVGLNAIIERPNTETLLQVMVSDLDYSSVYPMAKSSFNVSKETKLSTLIQIEGAHNAQAIESLCGGLASPTENAVPIGHRFFNLPNYSEMAQLYAQHLNNRHSRRTAV